MSRGLGRIQRACLDVISRYEAAGGRPPTTYTVTAEVYVVAPDKDNNRWVSDAQHNAVKRALYNLQQTGRIIGIRDQVHARAPEAGDYGIERCHLWMTESRLAKFLEECENSPDFRKRIARLAAAIGMNVS
jgi:hypothetical protein